MRGHKKWGSWARPDQNLPTHVPALDGVRGVAVMLVFISHFHWILSKKTGYSQVTPWKFINRTFEAGFLGVDIFFVLSGFLITSLLLKDHANKQPGMVGRFYKRRALRLLPALYALLIVDFFVAWLESARMDFQWRTTWRALLYLNNWNVVWNFRGSRNDLGHLWSLGIEEQFYIVWPAVVLLMLALKLHHQIIITVLSLAIAAIVVHRINLWNDDIYWLFIYIRTDTRVDSLLVGALFAYVYRHYRVPSQVLNWAATLCFAGLMYIKYELDASPFIMKTGFTVIAVLAGIIILAGAEGAWFANRVLISRPLTIIGKVSYGLYLWHLPVFLILGRHVTSGPKPLRILAGIIVASVVTVISWFFIEKPFLNLKNRRYANVKANN